MKLVKLNNRLGEEIYGTLADSGWPRFLSIMDFDTWPDEYSTYHAPLPIGSRWTEIEWDDIPESIKGLRSAGDPSWPLRDHVDWMLSDDD